MCIRDSVGSEMCIRDRPITVALHQAAQCLRVPGPLDNLGVFYAI
jgi:hypothetical protein